MYIINTCKCKLYLHAPRKSWPIISPLSRGLIAFFRSRILCRSYNGLLSPLSFHAHVFPAWWRQQALCEVHPKRKGARSTAYNPHMEGQANRIEVPSCKLTSTWTFSPFVDDVSWVSSMLVFPCFPYTDQLHPKQLVFSSCVSKDEVHMFSTVRGSQQRQG